jgi:DNA-binding transcriptional LysR family regulator
MPIADCRNALLAYPRDMISQLRSFLAVLEDGSLNRAAVRLRMSQPALTRQMQALENEVGGRLLDRTPAGVSPTDAGHTLAAAIAPVLAAYEAAFADARRLVRGQRDQLRIGYLGSAAQTYLNPALAVLRQQYPAVKVKLLDLSPGEQITALRRGEIDVALIGQEGCIAVRDFYTRKLATLGVLAVLPTDHPLAKRKKIPLDALRGERFIGVPEADMPGRDRWITQLCRKAGFKPNFVQQSDSISELLSLISSEGAIALVPSYMKGQPAAGAVMVPITDPHATWDFLVVWQRGKTATTARALIDALQGSPATGG